MAATTTTVSVKEAVRLGKWNVWMRYGNRQPLVLQVTDEYPASALYSPRMRSLVDGTHVRYERVYLFDDDDDDDGPSVAPWGTAARNCQ